MPCGTPFELSIEMEQLPLLLLEESTYGGARDAMRFSDLAQALASSALLEHSNPIDIKWPPADMPALQPGATHSCPHPFDDEIAFELCDGANDDHDGSS